MGASNELKGGPTSQEVNSTHLAVHGDAMLPSGYVWSSQENNTNNANYTSLPGGSTNNNNKNNTYSVVPVAEFDSVIDKYLDAEEDCFCNKKSRLDACKYHYHLSRMIELIRKVENGVYQPDSSICFVLRYPTYREVFAAKYEDRIVHHLVAPYIVHVAEAVHKKNGDVSHGNRVGFSAQTASEQIQARMREKPNGYILKMDLQGFFMSISRDVAWHIFTEYASVYKPAGLTDAENEFILDIIHRLLNSNPTIGCERRSPDFLWEKIRPEKLLFGNENGLPIGNYYSQLIANIILAKIDEKLHMTHFVDDFCGVFDSIADVQRAKSLFFELAHKLGLKGHPKKIYIQPVSHGVKFCGRVIFKDRMYIANRTVRACKNVISTAERKWDDTLGNAVKLIQSVNSYTGMMSCLNSYNQQIKLVSLVSQTKFWKYMVVKHQNNHVVLNLKREYTLKDMSQNAIVTLDKIHNNNDWNSKKLRQQRRKKA